MKHLILSLLLVSALASMAQSTDARQFSWLNSTDGESVVYAYLPSPDAATGKAIVDLPGGGYSGVAMQHEGHDWADFFTSQGIAYFVVRYRMPHGDFSIPYGDACHAIETVCDSAGVWGINANNIGVMGFSAGGHLASTVATHATGTSRPNFQILFYPVITMGEGTHIGSRNGFLGEYREDPEWIEEYSNEKQAYRAKDIPAIIIMSSDDTVVPVIENGVAYYQALVRAGATPAMHIFPTGEHGWGFRQSFDNHEEMKMLLSEWLKAE